MPHWIIGGGIEGDVGEDVRALLSLSLSLSLSASLSHSLSFSSSLILCRCRACLSSTHTYILYINLKIKRIVPIIKKPNKNKESCKKGAGGRAWERGGGRHLQLQISTAPAFPLPLGGLEGREGRERCPQLLSLPLPSPQVPPASGNSIWEEKN